MRKSQVRLFIESAGKIREYQAEVSGGTVLDRSEKIDLKQSTQACLMIEHAHRAVYVQDVGIIVLHGNLL